MSDTSIVWPSQRGTYRCVQLEVRRGLNIIGFSESDFHEIIAHRILLKNDIRLFAVNRLSGRIIIPRRKKGLYEIVGAGSVILDPNDKKAVFFNINHGRKLDNSFTKGYEEALTINKCHLKKVIKEWSYNVLD